MNPRGVLFLILAFYPKSCWSLVTPCRAEESRCHSACHALNARRRTSSLEEEEDPSGLSDLRGYDRVAELLREEIGLTDPHIASKIAEKAPSILRNADATLKNKINFFREIFNASNPELRKFVARAPQLLGMSTETIDGKVDYLKEVFHGEDEAVRSVALRHPTLLTYRVDENLRPKIEYMKERVFGGNHTALRSALLQMPALLSRSLEGRMKPRVEALISMGTDPSSCIWAWALKSTQDFETWLGSPVENEISRNQSKASNLYKFEQQTKFLAEELGLDSTQVQKVLERAPSIVPQTKANVLTKINFLRDTLGFSGEELQKVIVRQPPLLAGNVDGRLRPNVEYMTSFFNGNMTAVRRVLLKNPQVLSHSINGKLNLTSTYLLEIYDNDIEAVQWAVYSLPAMLTYSLEQRIRPRFEAVLREGVDIKTISASSILTKNDEKFELWLEKIKTRRKE